MYRFRFHNTIIAVLIMYQIARNYIHNSTYIIVYFV